MATEVLTGRMTVEEFYNHPDIPDNAELVHGEVRLVTSPETAHSWVARAVFRALDTHATRHALGEVFPDQTGYVLPHRNDTLRIPDVSFVRAGRLPVPIPRRQSLRLAPDLVVEVLSESDTYTVIRKKLTDYRDAGVQVVWLVDIDGRAVDVHTPDGAVRTLREDEALDGGDVLPGFAIPVRDLFAGIAAD